MAVGNHRNVGVIISIELLGWKNNLDALGVIGAWNWVVKEANDSDNS